MPLFSFEEYYEHFHNKYDHKFKWKCKKCGYEFSSAFTTSGYKDVDGNIHIVRCRKCYPLLSKFSKQEKQVVKFIKTIYFGQVIENTFELLKPNEENNWKANKEIDIYLPELKIAIEYNGDYFHNYKLFPDQKIIDDFKKKQCEDNGLMFITIWEHDWIYDNERVKNELMNMINKNNLKSD